MRRAPNSRTRRASSRIYHSMSISSRRSIAASAIRRNRNGTWPATVSSRVWKRARRRLRNSMSLDRFLILICGSFLPWPIAAAQHPPMEIQAEIVPLFQSARQAEQRREFSQAARLYGQIITLDPKLAEVWTNLGLVLHELDRHREALDAF